MANEATVNLDRLEEKFEEKMAAKENEIKSLKAQLEEFNKSNTKAALDNKDAEISSLREQVASLTKTDSEAKTLIEQRGSEIKSLNDKVAELNESLRVKTEAFDVAAKALDEIKAKQVLVARISEYRTKSGDTATSEEDLVKKFGTLSEDAFKTVMEFVKAPVVETKVDETKAAEIAKNAVTEVSKTVASETVVAPTETSKEVDPIREKASKLVKMVASQVFGETKTK